MKTQYMAAKALGFTNAISNLSREERQEYPSRVFGADYNNLLSHVRESCKAVVELLPPEATFSVNSFHDEICNQSFGELYAFCEQLYQMLSVIEAEE